MSNDWFSQLKKNYKDVSVTEEGIDAVGFCEASEEVVRLFDLLNSTAFAPVKADLSGNVTKIRTKYNTDPNSYSTLQKLVATEAREGKERTATQGLLWLLRGLDFTSKALRRNLENPEEELSKSFTEAYGLTLKQYHSFVVRPIFSLAMKACPYRKDFYAKLGSDLSTVQAEMNQWLTALEKLVAQMNEFYKTGDYGKGL
ncbi:glycolipid transfer protein [Basidiobolus meristosporus CBS 931.73]|uniref:Glycolipid transfer protein n=1 Tax=Basidiobolus meristosporus CBS 931.73 TaxID=1314790 RepID=A0A1Y1XY10_9FUNG|nr:glycolipid transfer protein [Basidiobolus meristosporus CBS 931.73]|eukprot:ORX90638.1 glycolipid transfer protein [Basidiobolus meristosporus CBS 931.73]